MEFASPRRSAKLVLGKTKPQNEPRKIRVAAPAKNTSQLDRNALVQLVRTHTTQPTIRDYYIKASPSLHKQSLPEATSSEITNAQRSAWANMPDHEKNQFNQGILHFEFGCCPKVRDQKQVTCYAVDYVRQQEMKMQKASKIDAKHPGKHRRRLYTWIGMMMQASRL